MAIWQGSPLLVTTGIVCYIVFAYIHDINNAMPTFLPNQMIPRSVFIYIQRKCSIPCV